MPLGYVVSSYCCNKDIEFFNLKTKKQKSMIRYKKYQMTGEKSPLKGLWYARPLIEDTFDTERLAKHMANHNTPYSEGLIKGEEVSDKSIRERLFFRTASSPSITTGSERERFSLICFLL